MSKSIQPIRGSAKNILSQREFRFCDNRQERAEKNINLNSFLDVDPPKNHSTITFENQVKEFRARRDKDLAGHFMRYKAN